MDNSPSFLQFQFFDHTGCFYAYSHVTAYAFWIAILAYIVLAVGNLAKM